MTNKLRILDLFKITEVSRTRDAIQIDSMDEWPYVFLVTAEALEVRFISAYSEPIEISELWKRRNWNGLKGGRLFQFLRDAAAEARLRERPCSRCGETLPQSSFRKRKRICVDCDGSRQSG